MIDWLIKDTLIDKTHSTALKIKDLLQVFMTQLFDDI